MPCPGIRHDQSQAVIGSLAQQSCSFIWNIAQLPCSFHYPAYFVTAYVPLPFNTLETVPWATPAFFAISLMVAICVPPDIRCWCGSAFYCQVHSMTGPSLLLSLVLTITYILRNHNSAPEIEPCSIVFPVKKM